MPTAPNQKICWDILGSYLRFTGSVDDLSEKLAWIIGTDVINLVNLEGTPEIIVQPEFARKLASRGIDILDSKRGWRNWVFRTFGDELQLTGQSIERAIQSFPSLQLSDMRSAYAPACIGLNIGGFYARLVHVDKDGRILYGPEIRLKQGQESPLSGQSLRIFCQNIASWISEMGWDYKFAGIAWAAPRKKDRIKTELLHLFDPYPELAQEAQSETLQNLLADALGCPVSFWHDGEAVACAEWYNSPDYTSNLISLKLGTSVACGAVFGGHLCLLPLELAKCIIPTVANLEVNEASHPGILITGTVRGAVGAGAISMRYYRSSSAAHRFPEFQHEVLLGKRGAIIEMRFVASALADVVALLKNTFGNFKLVISGKSVEESFGRFLIELLNEEHSKRQYNLSDFEITLTSWPTTYTAAIGAALLARSNLNA